jgi:hypothetical protein
VEDEEEERRAGPARTGRRRPEEKLKLGEERDGIRRWEGESERNKIKGEWRFVHFPFIFVCLFGCASGGLASISKRGELATVSTVLATVPGPREQ